VLQLVEGVPGGRQAGRRRQAGDTARAAATDEVKDLRQEARALEEVVAGQALEIRLPEKA
jgi:transposase